MTRGGTGIQTDRRRAPEAVIGVYDFSYAPYALGDALTWTMNLNVAAADAGLDAIDQYLVIDPARPSSRYQPFVNTLNYSGTIDGVFPAFLCSPRLRSLKLIRDAPTFSRFLLREVLRGRRMWPSFWSHLRRRLDFVSHRRINAFHAKHGTLPWLTAPRGYGDWADGFLRRHTAGRFLVAVHARQGALSVTPANIHRDSPMLEWRAFMRMVANTHPEVLFLVLGGYTELDRTLERLSNVLVPRTLGLGLGHELALLHRSDLFMGTSSGFAVMATFSNLPYVITKVEPLFARYIDVPVGARHHVFGDENQVLSWETETRDTLFEQFAEVYARVGKGARA